MLYMMHSCPEEELLAYEQDYPDGSPVPQNIPTDCDEHDEDALPEALAVDPEIWVCPF